MKKFSTHICIAILLGSCAALSCKKEDSSPSTRDQFIGRWLDADSVGSQDYDVFNADGTGIDTRITGSGDKKEYTFNWTVNGQTLTTVTTQGPTGGFCNVDGISTINVISSSKIALTEQTSSYHYVTTLIRQ